MSHPDEAIVTGDVPPFPPNELVWATHGDGAPPCSWCRRQMGRTYSDDDDGRAFIEQDRHYCMRPPCRCVIVAKGDWYAPSSLAETDAVERWGEDE